MGGASRCGRVAHPPLAAASSGGRGGCSAARRPAREAPRRLLCVASPKSIADRSSRRRRIVKAPRVRPQRLRASSKLRARRRAPPRIISSRWPPSADAPRALGQMSRIRPCPPSEGALDQRLDIAASTSSARSNQGSERRAILPRVSRPRSTKASALLGRAATARRRRGASSAPAISPLERRKRATSVQTLLSLARRRGAVEGSERVAAVAKRHESAAADSAA